MSRKPVIIFEAGQTVTFTVYWWQ